MEITDAVINWRSSVGGEFLAMGYQVISSSGSGLSVYPQELNYVIKSEAEFENALNAIPELNINQVIGIWKWFEFQSRRFSVSISPPNLINYDKLRPSHNQQFLKLWKIAAKAFVKLFPTLLQRRSARFWTIPTESVTKVHELLTENLSNLSEVSSWEEKFEPYSRSKEHTLLLKQISKICYDLLNQVGGQSRIIQRLKKTSVDLSK